MDVLTLADFSVLEELYSTDHFTAFHAKQADATRDVRLTVFSRALTESDHFRAAFRKDRTQLENLHHDTILQYLGHGEADGCLFYFTEFPGGRSLQRRLEEGQQFSWDEIADLGWQIASALQFAHNIGLCHAGLTAPAVLVNDALRAKVSGFGVYRWIAAAGDDYEQHTEADWLNSQSADLVAFGEILGKLTAACSAGKDADSPSGDRPPAWSVRAEVEQLVIDLESPAAPQFPSTAREVQGRLGNLLLSEAGDSIEIVDRRTGQAYGRRSIVDELFDDAETVDSAGPQTSERSDSSSRHWSSPAIILAAVVIAVVVVAIVLLTRQL